ncbi:efflux RND transporter periplasmic adaptor subunit [Paracidobacterium acidisoli]|uniref:Efflux RND transporter periplasmic adaptor subunit n=1 Tax=Paracidobacterium acidisoli TaxID=2303751 RepID=A0A372ISI2_9BACT|nr:efflux RND transporter periplasmic adaptor subunit [Paracidobacterium acidisoli]MBT9330648.1 efflux RND transporter periplasmic adaptor subunit [Paracidobacterium acidisoli]
MSRHRLLLYSVLILLPLTACNKQEQTAPETATPKQPMVDTITVSHQHVADQLMLPARITANPTDIVHVYPLISGRVLSLRVLPGQELKKGQQIGTLQSSDAAQARSDFEKAKIEATRADLQLSRAKELLQHEVMAQRDYDDLKALDDSDHAELERARQALRLLGFSENDTSDIVPITSPISGVVLDVNTGPGELQRSLDNANAIATIADIDTVWIMGDLYPRDQAGVHVGQPVNISVNGYPDMTLHGVIGNISDAVDPTSLTLKVRVVLPNPGHKLKPQMYATIAVTNQKRDVIVVPSTAVIQSGQETFVFVQTSPGKYERRNVVLGAIHEKSDEITQGLNDGDQIVSTGAELLRESEGQ